MSQSKLKNEIIERSEADSWEIARREWQLRDAWRSDELTKCLCGQPIKEVCQLVNLVNDNVAVVGCVCARRFPVPEKKRVFSRLCRIRANDLANPGEELLRYARERGAISDNDLQFGLKVCKKRKLNGEQKACRQDINARIIDGFSKQVPVEETPEQRRKFVPTERRNDRYGKGTAQWKPAPQEKAKKAN